MAEQFENNYATTLNGAINNSVTTITVVAAPTTMTGSFRIKIESEIILVGAVSGLTFTGCTRGVEGTTAASHADSSVVTHVLTAQGLRNASITGETETVTTTLAADVSLTGSFADVMSVSLSAGAWLVMGQVQAESTSGAGNVATKLTDGSTVFDAMDVSCASGFSHPITMITKISLSATTTIKVQAKNNAGTIKIAKTGVTAGGNVASLITAIRLSVGSTTAGSSIGAQAWTGAAQSIPANTITPITFANETYDTDGFHDTGSNTSRMTIPTGLSGKYLLSFSCYVPSGPSSLEFVFRKNGTTYVPGTVDGNGTPRWVSTTTVTNLVAGDYVEVVAYQNSGGPINIGIVSSTSDNYQQFSIALLTSTQAKAYGQTISYPLAFSGDDDDFTSFSNWADVSAFDTATILNSTVGHLITKGASKDQKKRFTLATTKATTFDFRWWGVIPDLVYWSSAEDSYVDLALKTSADAHVAGFRIRPLTAPNNYAVYTVAGGSVITTNIAMVAPRGSSISFRITRDGSNNCRWYMGVGVGAAPTSTFLQAADNVPYNGTPSGTIARSEILIHTPSGPGASSEFGMYIDIFQSV